MGVLRHRLRRTVEDWFPDTVFYRGMVGKEKMCRLGVQDAITLGDRLVALQDALG